ncbi:T-lymphocyte activation antigen CD80-like [Centroberyx affinis]|uniref:T-lymphocyte activation antigen CD80-like n=1 Tax=Centroberyx affinis TaxID=166261 RepID=UPI003A5BF915
MLPDRITRLQYSSGDLADQLFLSTSRAQVNMKTFLGLLIAFISVSGNENQEVILKGVSEQNILLPCSCSSRNLDKEVIWQIKETTVLHYQGNTSDVSASYEGRAEIFLTKNDSNCSLLLSNITLADQGMYKCNFHSTVYNQGYHHTEYNYAFIHLEVSVSYSICQKSGPGNDVNGNVRVFQCDVSRRHPEDRIDWQLDGQPLEKPSTTDATYIAPTGLHHLSSNLTMELNGNSEPKCVVKNPAISTSISYSCSKHTDPSIQDHTFVKSVVSSSVIVAVVLLLVFSLVLYHCQTSKRVTEEKRADVTTELWELNGSNHPKSKNLILVTAE